MTAEDKLTSQRVWTSDDRRTLAILFDGFAPTSTMPCVSFLCMCICGQTGLLLYHSVHQKNYVLLLNRTISILQRRSNLAVVRGCTKIRISPLRNQTKVPGMRHFITCNIPRAHAGPSFLGPAISAPTTWSYKHADGCASVPENGQQ